MDNILKVHDNDNVIAALVNLNQGDVVSLNGEQYEIKESIPMKHKFAAVDFAVGDLVTMYGVRIGIAKVPITEVGIAKAETKVAVVFRKKTNTIKTERKAPKIRSNCTLSIFTIIFSD